MPKSSKEKIDLDEKKIIRELEKNAKESIDKIAKKCGCSRQKVWRIIKRLEENKIIWGYHAVIDNEKIGLNRYYILIKRTNVPFSKEHIDSIIKNELKPEIGEEEIIVENISYVHGSFDGVYEIRARNIMQVKKFIESFYNLAVDYISDAQILEVIFPVEINGIVNPNIKEIEEFFTIE